MIGMSERTGTLIASIVAGVLSSVFFDSTLQEEEVRDPESADVDDDARDDLIHVVADAEPREQVPDERAGGDRGQHARDGLLRDARDDGRHAGADEELALDGDVEHAAALGQDACEGPQGDRRGELQRAAEDAGQVRHLAGEQRAEHGRDQDRQQDDQ